jgi:hypothetical protein
VSLKIPRFHFRRGPASFSSAEVIVVVVEVMVALFVASDGRVSLRQGLRLTMLGSRDAPTRNSPGEEGVEKKIKINKSIQISRHGTSGGGHGWCY